MKENNKISGQIFVRETGQTPEKLGLQDDNRQIVMVIGILAIPKGSLNGEHQYPILGFDHSNPEKMIIEIANALGKNIENQSQYISPNQLLTMPIWKI